MPMAADMFTVLMASDQPANPMDFPVDLALFTLVVFVGLLFLLGRFAWKPLLAALDRRERAIADNIENARRSSEQAQQALRDYEQRLADVTREANDILAAARKDSEAARERILAEASAEARRVSERAMADIQAAREAAVRELAQRSAESAVDLAGRIVGRSLNTADHQRLIEESIDGFSRN